jgi:predicted PurR-regulated permease PerM
LWFGGWFWGVAGIVMAVPTLLSLKVVAQHSRLGGPLTAFLSPEKTTLAPVAAVVARIKSQTHSPEDRSRPRQRTGV